MGLDIHIETDNSKEIFSANYFNSKIHFRNHSLSRTFCNFMCRQHVARREPELEQIGSITGVDISPLYDMEKYWDDEGSVEHQLSFANSEEESVKIQARLKADRDRLKGNIDLVLKTIDSLIRSLSTINDLDKKLDDSDEDTLGYEFYFTDFSTDKGDGYIGNNFGQDLRNFKRFLEYARSNGTTTVWFSYG